MACSDETSLEWETSYERRLRDDLQRFRMNASHVAQSLSLKDDLVLCVFLVGSRVWGTANRQSDWDFVVVMSKVVWDGEKPIDRHAGVVDGHILSREQFEAGLKQQRFRYILCLHLPSVCVLRSRWNPKWSLDVPVMLATFTAEKERDLRMARKYFDKGDRFRACKTLVHSVRMFALGKELIESGTMTQFGTGQDELTNFRWQTPEQWSDLQKFVDEAISSGERELHLTVQKLAAVRV